MPGPFHKIYRFLIISQYDERAPYNQVIGRFARVPTDIK